MSIAAERKKAGYTQMETAEALGVSDAAVCQWETGKTSPRASMLVKLAQLFSCTVDELLTEEEIV